MLQYSFRHMFPAMDDESAFKKEFNSITLASTIVEAILMLLRQENEYDIKSPTDSLPCK